MFSFTRLAISSCLAGALLPALLLSASQAKSPRPLPCGPKPCATVPLTRGQAALHKGLPDLTVSFVSLKHLCGKVQYSVRITNNGPGTVVTSKPPLVTMYPQNMPAGAWFQPEATPNATLKAGESTSVLLSAPAPWPPSMTYFMIFEVDPKNVYKEKDESNNTTKTQVPVGTICK